jgi:hypothetical protein
MRAVPGSQGTGIVVTSVFLLGFVAACDPTPTSSATSTASSTPSASPASSSTPDPTAGWVSYRSTTNHLTFRHPAVWQPVECNGVTAVDNATATCTPGEGPAATLTIFTDQGQTNYTGGWSRSAVSVNGQAGKCFTDSPTTQTPVPNNGPVLAYSSYTVCDVATGSRTYHFTFYVPSPPAPNPSNHVTQVQFEQLLRTAVFDS